MIEDRIYDLVPSTDPLLRTKMEPFDFKNPPVDPVVLANALAKTMINNKGLGLSANQCGLPFRVFVMNGNPITACFNPRIVNTSDESVVMAEGCLSYPRVFCKIKRPAAIRVRYQEPNGNTVTKDFQGITARCFQHELDHLNGIVYLDRASRFHREQAFKAAKDVQRMIKRQSTPGALYV